MTVLDKAAKKALADQVERIEAMERQIRETRLDINAEYAVCKSKKLNVKMVREVVRQRLMDPNDRVEARLLLETYLAALGMTPIEAAIAEAAE